MQGLKFFIVLAGHEVLSSFKANSIHQKEVIMLTAVKINQLPFQKKIKNYILKISLR